MDLSYFEEIVDKYYAGLYRFAWSLSDHESEAGDLTQQTFLLWAQRGHQLRDRTKIKTWLFTTLYREFLAGRRRQTRHPEVDISSVNHELPPATPNLVQELDAKTVLRALLRLDEIYRVPLMLFYQDDHSYQEIAEILGLPIGTVMSRISRGKAQLRASLAEQHSHPSNILPFSKITARNQP